MGNKIFRIVLDVDELKTENASFSLGYFEFSTLDFKVSFFEERQCMVFITLSSLLDFLSNELKNGMSYKWVGDGNGTTILVKVADKKRIEFLLDRFSLYVNIDDFAIAVIEYLNSFLTNCINVNPEILNESGYRTLKSSLDDLKNKRIFNEPI